MVKTIGRIVSNPPWVRLNTIHDIERKKEIEIMAKERKLWVGGNVATSFDVATLFVDNVLPYTCVEKANLGGYFHKQL